MPSVITCSARPEIEDPNSANTNLRGHTVHQCVVIQGHSVRLDVVIFRLYVPPLRCCLCRHARPMLVPSVYALPGQPSSPTPSFLVLVTKSPSAGLMLRAVPGRLPHRRDDLRQSIMRRLILVPVQTACQPLATTCSPRPTPSEDPADSPRNERKSLIQVRRLEDDYLTNFKLVQEALMFRQHPARESSKAGRQHGRSSPSHGCYCVLWEVCELVGVLQCGLVYSA